MDYLSLCQMVARESGTVSGTLPSSVAGQTGRLSKIVFWTNDAWRQIQNRRNAWRWMRAEFGAPDAVTVAGTKRYTSASFNLTRWAEWITEEDTVSSYLQSTGVADEQPLLFMPWSLWKRTYDRGEQQQDRPIHYTISPAGEFCIGPTPDDTYVIRGEYRKSPQSLTANDDVPELPARFHDIIAWYALLLLAEHDEGGQLPLARAGRNYNTLMDDLERDQLPQLVIGANALA